MLPLFAPCVSSSPVTRIKPISLLTVKMNGKTDFTLRQRLLWSRAATPLNHSFRYLNHHLLWWAFLWLACLQLLPEFTLLHTSQKMKSKPPPTHQPTHKGKGRQHITTAVESGDGNIKGPDISRGVLT